MNKPDKRKKSFVRRDYDTIITGFALIGTMIFRISLEHMIGDKGLACYGTAYEIYIVLGGMITYGLSEAVCSLVRYRIRREQYKNAQKVLGSALMLGGIIGTLLSILFGFLGHILSEKVLKVPLAGLAVCMMAPAIVFLILTGIFRGYFQGNGSRMPAIHSRILQIVVLFISGLVFSNIFSGYGSRVSALLQNNDFTGAYGAMGASLGIAISSFLCFLHMLVLYLLLKTNRQGQMIREMSKGQDTRFHIFHMLFGSGVLYFLYWFFFQGQTLVGELIMMRYAGESNDMLTAWGAYYGKVLSVVGILCCLLGMICLPSVRKLVALLEKDEYRLAREKMGTLIHLSAALSVPTTILLAVFSENLLDVLFGGSNERTAAGLQLGSIMVVLYLFSIIFMEFLLRSRKLAYVTGIGAGAFLLYTILLIMMAKSPKLGINALVIAGIVFYAVVAIGGFLLVGRRIQYRQEWLRGIILIILSGAVSGIIAMLLNRAIVSLTGELISFCICFVVAIAVYLVLLTVTRAITPDEMEKIPGGWLLIKLAELFQIV